MSADELEVEKARRAFEQNDRDRDKARHEHAQETAAARATVERARKYVVDSGLDKIVPNLWTTVQYWGSWAGKPDQWQPPQGVEGVAGGGDRDHSFASWTWSGRRFQVDCVKKLNYTPDGAYQLADLLVKAEGELVLALACTRTGYESWEPWRMATVDTLKVGPWMAELIRCAGHIQLTIDRGTWRTFARSDEERAAHIDFRE